MEKMLETRPEQRYRFAELSLGTCYYPEHWDSSLWRSDLQRMKALGIFTVRVGEFAWNTIEPQEGVFTFTFWDSFLDIAQEEGMKVIFGTPTATPPVWLTQKHPEALNCRIDGASYYPGMRRHYNYNSAKYQELCCRIVDKMASHFAKRPCVIGWQIDNEINCETDVFYSQADTLAFRKFLQEKYQTLDNLNKAWGTLVWNQTYTEWSEVYVPRLTIHDSVNPHQILDYYRFVSASAIRFCKIQADIIRKYKKDGDFITTNGMFRHLDNHRMTDEALDVYCYDSYPNFAYLMECDPANSNDLNDRMWSRNLSKVRSVCKNFGIMEQQSGANGWNTRMAAPAPKPGQVMLWAMQSIANGADYVSFFRWRTAPMGTEIYWHGILDYDSKDNRKSKEIAAIFSRVQNIAEIVNAEYKANVAILRDYDNDYDAELDVWHKRLDESDKEIWMACALTHTPVDYVYLLDYCRYNGELNKYKVIFYPHPVMLTETKAQILRDYVEQGGTLIIGARSGLKDGNGHCPMRSMPGPLAPLTKTEVSDFTFIGPADDEQKMSWNGKTLPTGIFADILTTTGSDAEVLADYTNNYFAGQAALVETKCGKGKVLHFGGTFVRQSVREFLDYTETAEPYAKEIELPAEVEIAVREKDGKSYYFLLNYSKEEKTVRCLQPFTDMDTHKELQGELVLAPYGTKVLRR